MKHPLLQPHPRVAGDHLRTAGQQELAVAEFHTWTRDDGIRATLFDAAGGPIDAPQRMPAGSCNSWDYCDCMRRPVGGQTDFERGLF